jgi:hypothetical protein
MGGLLGGLIGGGVGCGLVGDGVRDRRVGAVSLYAVPVMMSPDGVISAVAVWSLVTVVRFSWTR